MYPVISVEGIERNHITTDWRFGSVSSLKYMPPMYTISATVLFEALIALLCRDFPCVADVVSEVMEWIARTVLQEVNDPTFSMVMQTSYLDYFLLISEKKIDNHNWRVHVCGIIEGMVTEIGMHCLLMIVFSSLFIYSVI